MFHGTTKLRAEFLLVNKGFSLVELLVTMGIMAIIMGALFLNYGAFTGRIDLENLAYEIAIVLRQAQVYGVAVKETKIGTEEFPIYGVNVEFLGDPDLGTKIFDLFADIVPPGGDGQYNDPLQEHVETFTIERASYISAIRGCTSSCVDLSRVAITFARPNLQAIFNTFPAGFFTHVEIEVRSARQDIPPRFVRVWNNGQIAVD